MDEQSEEAARLLARRNRRLTVGLLLLALVCYLATVFQYKMG